MTYHVVLISVVKHLHHLIPEGKQKTLTPQVSNCRLHLASLVPGLPESVSLLALHGQHQPKDGPQQQEQERRPHRWAKGLHSPHD